MAATSSRLLIDGAGECVGDEEDLLKIDAKGLAILDWVEGRGGSGGLRDGEAGDDVDVSGIERERGDDSDRM